MDRTETQPSSTPTPSTTNILSVAIANFATIPPLPLLRNSKKPSYRVANSRSAQTSTNQNLYRYPATIRHRTASLYWLSGCLAALALHAALADCPSLCECKWKSGKETVMCLNANLTHIPIPLDAGTQVLDLTGNEITSIPHDTFAAAELLNLQKVYLAKCRLRMIERFAFRKLINLVELDLSYNQLTSIPADAFEAIPELRELKLTGNPIQRVPNEAFVKTPQLVRLDLADCRLSFVELRAFAGLEVSLEWLRLDGNKLSEVRARTITSLSNLHGIELARNQWNCSCNLRPLRAWMLRENIPYGIPPICRSPERLAGRTWDKIDLDDFACVPQIIATDTTAHGVEGRNITMSCYVEGVPEPSVRWMVKNRVIANLSSIGSDTPASLPRTAATTQGRKTYVVNMLRNASNLTILTADMQDAGIYTCAAENKAGKVEASVTLAVSRRPPEAPLSVKIVLLCIFISLLFVIGSSFAAICFCSLRRKRKMRLWNTVPPARTESYEKIEMTTRSEIGGNNGRSSGSKRDLSSTKGSGAGDAALTIYCTEENGYLRSASEEGIAIVNLGGTHAKRNGEYRNVSTHCDDENVGCSNDNQKCVDFTNFTSTTINTATNKKTPSNTCWKSNAIHHSPEVGKRKGVTTSTSSVSASTMNPSSTMSTTTKTTTDITLGDTDLHIPRLIDIGSNHGSPASSSISSQVDAATRLAATYTNVSTWTTQLPTTKITSIHSKGDHNGSEAGVNGGNTIGPYYRDNRTGDRKNINSNFVSKGHELFDGKYPDLLDIAKYAVAQATSKASFSMQGVTTHNQLPSSGLCTLPRKLKTTGKYFKNSSDSQSPLLADNCSKYSSSVLGDAGFLDEATSFDRRYSSESTHSSTHCNAPGATLHTVGQRSNSFLNLVQSCNRSGAGPTSQAFANISTTAAALPLPRRNPSLPSSPVHEVYQHQRSFSSAATPLLDFSLLTTRSGTTVTTTAMAVSTTGINPAPHSTVVTPASSTAYDYHAAQLERFLEEYRNLQDQLCKMKETCETIRKKDTPLLRGHAAQLADPVMFNAAIAANSPTTNPKTMLQNKAILPGQPPDPPPYWLHRNAMLKRLNDTPANIFKS